jgi:hypothetical protein
VLAYSLIRANKSNKGQIRDKIIFLDNKKASENLGGLDFTGADDRI